MASLYPQLPEDLELSFRVNAAAYDMEWWFNSEYETSGFIEVEADNENMALELSERQFVKLENFKGVFFFRDVNLHYFVNDTEVENILSGKCTTITLAYRTYKVKQ